MTRQTLILLLLVVFLPLAASGQEKGIDTQTKTIRDTRSTDRGNDVSRTFTWDGKTKVRSRLANPYTLVSRRDVLVKMIIDVLKEDKVLLDESASRLNEGLVVTRPVVFSKGAIITRTELNRYADVPPTDQIWTRGRYTLTVEVQSVDGMKNNIYVVAKIEGRSESGIFSEWSTLESSGTAEEEFLVKLLTYMGNDLDSQGRRP